MMVASRGVQVCVAAAIPVGGRLHGGFIHEFHECVNDIPGVQVNRLIGFLLDPPGAAQHEGAGQYDGLPALERLTLRIQQHDQLLIHLLTNTRSFRFESPALVARMANGRFSRISASHISSWMQG